MDGTSTRNGNIFLRSYYQLMGVLGKEAQVVLATLSRLVAAKMEEPISHVKGWVNSQISTSVSRS